MDTGRHQKASNFQSTFHTARNRWAASVAKFSDPVAVERHYD